jgi:hypothetical protein
VDDLLSIAVSNAVAATVLALVTIAVSTVYRRPALVHGLWLLVLLKLVTPPLVFLPIAWPAPAESPPEVAAVSEGASVAPLAAAEEWGAPVVDTLGALTQPRSPDDTLGVLTQPRSPDDTLGALTQPRSPDDTLLLGR